MVQNISAQSSTFGGINKIGVDTNGRIIYQVVDSSGQEAGKMTIAPQDADTFEKSYNDIMNQYTIQKMNSAYRENYNK